MQINNKNENNDIKMNNKNDNKNNEINNRTVKVFLNYLDKKKLMKTVCYKDINFFLLLNSAKTYDLLALKIDL